MNNTTKPLIKIEHLTKHFPIKSGFFNRVVAHVQALTDLSIDIDKGETIGLVGESGCGKSTAGRCILNLIKPTSGSVFFEGEDVLKARGKQQKLLRRQMQIIFQNPYSSLDPRMIVKDIITEPLLIHKIYNAKGTKKRLYELIDMVGLSESMLDRYPHEFSGGQRQRISIARALALNPKFIVADEPVSALDVSIQAQILNLMVELKNELNLTYLFISHNLNVVHYISDKIAVMYLGEIVEFAEAETLYHDPKHPYSEALINAIPIPNPTIDISNRILLEGDVPSPVNPPSGCTFHPRCLYAKDVCSIEKPLLRETSPNHFARCHFSDKLNLTGLNTKQIMNF